MLTKRFDYKPISRTMVNGKRFYQLPDGSAVASVTTILEATKPQEQVAALHNWRCRVGKDKAAEITIEASSRGTRMHKYLENFILKDDTGLPGSNPFSIQSHAMAHKIVDHYLKPHITEYYGTEVSLCYPGLYAGTTDGVVLWQDRLCIIDFKQTNKPKKTSWIENYLVQIAAYSEAHDKLYSTKVQQGVVLMCSKDLAPQAWILEEKQLDHYKDIWWNRVEKFYLAQ